MLYLLHFLHTKQRQCSRAFTRDLEGIDEKLSQYSEFGFILCLKNVHFLHKNNNVDRVAAVHLLDV